jgi:tRNA (mo5U34)-methyltransferase
MDCETQAEIDRIKWYHDFDFPGGLQARADNQSVFHRRLWPWMEDCLANVDFRNKSVLDIGCWDGYWSFLAERRGAGSVLATDDVSQNWGEGTGIRLAKRLLHSKIEINQHLSIYDLASLNRKFDVILCLGVYYHLYAPLCGLAQIRHLCGPNTVVVLEGDVARGLAPGDARYCFPEYDRSAAYSGPAFLPSVNVLNSMVESAYLLVVKSYYLNDAQPQGPIARVLRQLKLKYRQNRIRRLLRGKQGPYSYPDRTLLICRPFVGVNKRYQFKPPFGLEKFDVRFVSNGLADGRADQVPSIEQLVQAT